MNEIEYEQSKQILMLMTVLLKLQVIDIAIYSTAYAEIAIKTSYVTSSSYSF
jgi:hypothetical protein